VRLNRTAFVDTFLNLSYRQGSFTLAREDRQPYKLPVTCTLKLDLLDESALGGERFRFIREVMPASGCRIVDRKELGTVISHQGAFGREQVFNDPRNYFVGVAAMLSETEREIGDLGRAGTPPERGIGA
jgi:hypothetical protein